MRRGCLCNLGPDASDICPAHVLCKALVGKAPGCPLFPTWKAKGSAALLASLRGRLTLLGTPNPAEYGLQSLRRGHAQQLLDDGGTLADVLKAGQWSSPAFLLYLDYAEVEQTAVLESWCFPASDHEED